MVTLETARALDGMGQTWTADTALAGLHARGFYTADSLRLAFDMQTRLGKLTEARQTQELMANLLSSTPQAQYDRALALKDSGRTERAIEALVALASDEAIPAEIRTQALADLVASGASAAALKAMESGSGLQTSAASLLRGRALETQGDIAGAQAAFEGALETNFSWETASNLANFWYRQGSEDRAETVFRNASEQRPEASWPKIALGKILLERGQVAEALELATTVWADNPNSLDAATILTEIHFTAKDWAKAETWAQRAIDLDDEREPNAALFYWLGAATLNQGNAQFARSWLSRAQTVAGDDPTILEALASCDFALGNHASALDLLRRLEAAAGGLNPTFRSLSIQALMRAERYDAALSEIETHQESLGAENAMALRVLIQEKQGDVPAALATLEAFAQTNPGSVTALRLNVFVQARSGDIASGIALARSEGDWSENDWSELAGIAISRKEFPSAMIALGALTEAYPEQPSYWNNLAWIRLDVGGEGSGEKAVVEAEKARALDPDNPDVIDTYARALTATQRFQEVLEVAEPWSKRQAASPRWHWYLGQAQEALENREQAVFHYREVKTLADTGLSQGIDVNQVLERLDALGAALAP